MNLGGSLWHPVLLCPVIKVNGHLENPNFKHENNEGQRYIRDKCLAILPHNPLGPVEKLTNGEGNLEWIVETGHWPFQA